MDLLAALALVMVIEGLALAIFSRSVPTLLGELDRIGPIALRRLGVFLVAAGFLTYLLVRGAGSTG
jgi:uncharacterized protein YjeT (DUF2065 family)